MHRLRHPCVAQLFGLVLDDDDTKAYLHMRWYSGGNLKKWSQEEKRSESELQSVAHNILDGVSFLHSNRVIHCDIKRENVFVDADGGAVIGDFDISKDQVARTATLAATAMAGTHMYLAPELLREPDRPPTPAADIYAVGVTLLLLNSPEVEKKMATLSPRPDASAAVHATGTTALDDLLQSLLAPEAERRISAAEALRTPYVSATAALARERELQQQAERQRQELQAASAREGALQEDAEQQRRELQRWEATTQPPAYWALQDVDALEPNLEAVDGSLLPGLTRLLRDFIFDHPLHRAGCGPAGIPSLVEAEVTRAVRVENMQLWKRYCHKKAELRAQSHGDDRLARLLDGSQEMQRAVRLRNRTEALLPGGARLAGFAGGGDGDLFLFHGTNPAIAEEKIARHGFDERVTTNGLYGLGSYFTDHSCKAHQYTGYLSRLTGNQPELTPQGEHCMLLSRVQLGSVHATTTHHNGERRVRPQIAAVFVSPQSN